MNRSIRTALVAAALVLGAAGAASADARTVIDPSETESNADIHVVSVKHTLGQVRTKVGVNDLRPTSKGGPSSISIFIDTDAAKPGPEFRLGSGLQEGSDYQLVAMKDWAPVGEPMACSHSVKLDFHENVVKTTVARTCLGSPEIVRIGVKTTDAFDPSHVLVDWLNKKRGFTTWVAAG